MPKLIAELNRLYLPADAVPPAVLAEHLLGRASRAFTLTDAHGKTRALHIAFPKLAKGAEDGHWKMLCAVANALQTELDLPAPAVSISGDDGYGLWLSLATPVPVALAQQFLELLHSAYFPDSPLAPDAAGAPVELPPCLHPRSGKWAAFINPGLGASFAEEPGLDMAPPTTGQVSLLEGLQSISDEQFLGAMEALRPAHPAASPSASPPALPRVSTATSAAEGLLLKDATLEDIVRHLHGMQIEPTFRHLLRD